MILTCCNLSLQTERKILFQSLSFTSLAGSIVYLKGENGSGKSSFLRLLAGVQKPTKGDIKINNIDITILEKPFAVFIGHEIGIKIELTVLENLLFWANLYNSYFTIDAAIYYFNLTDLLKDKVYNLSSGNKQKLALARLLISNASLWLLDEVDCNLDENNTKLLHNLIVTKVNSGGIIFFATHLPVFTNNSHILNLQNYV